MLILIGGCCCAGCKRVKQSDSKPECGVITVTITIKTMETSMPGDNLMEIQVIPSGGPYYGLLISLTVTRIIQR